MLLSSGRVILTIFERAQTTIFLHEHRALIIKHFIGCIIISEHT